MAPEPSPAPEPACPADSAYKPPRPRPAPEILQTAVPVWSASSQEYTRSRGSAAGLLAVVQGRTRAGQLFQILLHLRRHVVGGILRQERGKFFLRLHLAVQLHQRDRLAVQSITSFRILGITFQHRVISLHGVFVLFAAV